MDKKALIAIGVIAALGIGTYMVIVSKNKPTTSNISDVVPPKKTTTDSNNSSSNPIVDIVQSTLCKFLKIGCPATTDTTKPSTAIS